MTNGPSIQHGDRSAEVRRISSMGFAGPRMVERFDLDMHGELGEHEFDVETLYSGISAGTELTQFRGTNPYLHGKSA